MKLSDEKRVEKVKHFVKKNKVFTIIACLLILWTIFGVISDRKPDTIEPEKSSDSMVQEVETDHELHWHFYWSDLLVLVIGGGSCTVMIIRERKKAREKLK